MLKSQGAKRDQLTISWQVDAARKIVIVSEWSQINSSDHQHTYYYDVQSHQWWWKHSKMAPDTYDRTLCFYFTAIHCISAHNFDILSPRFYMSLHSKSFFYKSMNRQRFPRLSELFQCSLSGRMYNPECGWHQYQNNHLFIHLTENRKWSSKKISHTH